VHGGTYLRITENPTHDHSGPVTRVRLTATPDTPATPATPGYGLARQLTFGLNQAVARVVGARTNGM